ncbi:NAD(P)-dependent dehydrogenase (short-subunit alcohol dehydrogenase family) [Motilibacter peucedani]|uniref:NAD(P)-dependent dehydrogenase (Short-subunit alcohol dehydrogenase family) n=1 Tax=Motilibacter peucedani TaxID=598650 RepID=A0A420XRE0_9ACTN|nr:SDR family oxidoreductase [Motilibacter peucedani]RKS77473.1 NAD(P)-dependent dehydrogenase (short-subunit alcohol dehydrogenase family) [Motilibacter peucedani]
MTAYASYPSLRGRSVLVSGGATGLGAEFVSQFAAQGASVAFVDVQDAAGEALAAETGAVFRRVDVSDLEAYAAAIADLAAATGPFTVLVNNAANDARHRSAEVTPAFWDERMRVNLDHHFFATQAVVPMMRAAGGGSVINLGSISTHIKLRDLVVYRTAKAAIEGLTRALAQELGPDGIRVNCIVPGWVMTARQLEHWVDAEAEATIEREQALSRRLVPADVARMALWLAADDSAACTAQSWVVDGGWM